MAEIMMETVVALEAKIEAVADDWAKDPASIPSGVEIRAGSAFPWERREAHLEAAAAHIAPGWDTMMERYISGIVRLRLGIYRGTENG